MRPKITLRSGVVALVWTALVAAALLVTLDSLRTDDFDGLNFIFQIPFALPWLLIPIGIGFPIGGIGSHETDAWIFAGFGWLNGFLLLLFLEHWLRLPGEQ